jgi:hypothetical protein
MLLTEGHASGFSFAQQSFRSKIVGGILSLWGRVVRESGAAANTPGWPVLRVPQPAVLGPRRGSSALGEPHHVGTLSLRL